MARPTLVRLAVLWPILCASIRQRASVGGEMETVIANSAQLAVIEASTWDGKNAANGGSVTAGVGVFKSGLKSLKGKNDQEQLGNSMTNVGLLVLALAPADPSFTCLIVGGVLAGTGALISEFAEEKTSTIDALKHGFQQVGVKLTELKEQIANIHQDIVEMRGDLLELKNQDLEAYLEKTRSNYNLFIESLQYATPKDHEALKTNLVMLSNGLEMDEFKTNPARIATYLADIMRAHGGYKGYAMAAWKFHQMLGARLERFAICMPAATSGRGAFMFVNMCIGHLDEDLRGYQSHLAALGLTDWIRAPKKLLMSYIGQDRSLHGPVKKAIDTLNSGYLYHPSKRADSSTCYDSPSEDALAKLKQIGAPAAADAVPELRRQLFHDCHLIWSRALDLIVEFQWPTAAEAVSDLRRIIADPDTIASRGGPRKAENFFWRSHAVEGIVKIGGPAAEEAIPDLIWSLQNDESHKVRLASALAIGSIGGAAAGKVLPVLRKAAAEEGLNVTDGARDARFYSMSQFSIEDLSELKDVVNEMEAAHLWQLASDADVFHVD